MLGANTHGDSARVPHEDEVCDPACTTTEQATAIGGMLAASVLSSGAVPAHRDGAASPRGSHSSVMLSAVLHHAVDSHSILRTMKAQHAWFVPMLEVLSASSSDAALPRPIVGGSRPRQLTTTVSPESPIVTPPSRTQSSTSFDAWCAPHPGNIQPRKLAPAPVTDEHCAGERTDAVSKAVRIMMISEVLYRTKLCRNYLSVLSSVYYVLRAANHYFLGSHKLLTWEFPSFAHPAYASESAPHRTRDLCSPLAMRLFIGTATTFVQVGGNSLAVATVAELMPSRVATSSSRILPGPRG